ncbi:MAG TPA: bifunctional 1-(5-phosphoribosyl)-5-((5-phosphoribosylamino)methylideneamino)imidazole-4-carboxamide isomerase/phosphoribosylanthranilate isomerase PriA [Candidatus Stackebrandtia faecavium]|nr:bifunctional 1-(5-phosphoribosyl)-5-((5-phosphoribosylamino)methylideneamino)imidazole-4-carboxamide isomerase/phosphoribosylanthranilate isomerase PriA [Candidatus Stackebrandtia faecavium]
MSLTLLPAVDISDGHAVQLVQGEADRKRQYGDPVTAAKRWVDAGAQWLHVVDLDAAFGHGDNAATVARIVSELPVQVEVSGGIRDDASLQRALEAGAARVNIGTAALENPAWCDAVVAAYGERVAVSLDARGDTLSAHGWTRDHGGIDDVVARLEAAGCRRYVVTDVTVDGTLSGPGLALLRRICDMTPRPVIASGGVATLEDLRAITELGRYGVEGVIVGTALYEGKFTVAQAMRVLEGQ